MIACILLGIFIGRKFYKEYEKEGTVQGALFAILGLLLAFTFSMSLSRYDKRIDIIIEEAMISVRLCCVPICIRKRNVSNSEMISGNMWKPALLIWKPERILPKSGNP